MTISELYTKEEISTLSYHVCKQNKLYTVKDVKEYYLKYKSFDNLLNCERKSSEELVEICNTYQLTDCENNELESEKEDPLKTMVLELTKIQREVINSFIFVNTNDLSVRSKNGVSTYLKGDFEVSNFAKNIFFNENFILSEINNIGPRSIPELETYIETLKNFIFEVVEYKNEKQLVSLKNGFLIQRTFSISKIPDKVVESGSIFLFTDFLLNQNVFFDETQTAIVKKTLKIYQDQKELTLENIATDVGLSGERVRQIRKICIGYLFNKLLFIQNFNDDLLQKYNIDINSNQVEVNSENVRIINRIDNINLSQGFITYILFVYLHDRFSLVGNVEDVLQPRYFRARNRHNWNNFYLFDKYIASEVEFNSLADDINRRLRSRIEKSYSFNFKSYLSRFLTNNNIEILDSALPLAKKIVNEEFELSLDLDKNIVFKRNTSKQGYEYAYEALEELGKPSKVREVFEKVIELHPNYNTEEAKVRVSMRRKNGFVPVGRRSVFGLKKWEGKLNNFKGGTIRGIVEEYLAQFNTPKHISEITNHVLKFRPDTNPYSISQNLKLDKSGIYVFYKDSNTGLSTKKYDDSFIKISEIEREDKRSWEESLGILNDFIDKENRLPHSSGCPNSEEKLYRWFNIQKRRYRKGKLNIEKGELIRQIYERITKKNLLNKPL